ncbi:Glutamine cyclotransferase [Streptomyces sp. ADI96-02]|uniref:glutaminyl-peptide cyclotransferase n=1 Tax=unclassified Streptomyces TaxID=2593676 RepID=UPI000F54DF9C|nr:glutaminyl-peptide cyclotransferase [Streptomyces sp. ADI96-02]RPK54719.1 Glutamine cyclotransferase [Streptomyces sp. ADI96-02]
MRFRSFRTLHRLPHRGQPFVQGIEIDRGTIWESTGRYGRSTLRRLDAADGTVRWSRRLPDDLFAEGICRVGDVLWQLTWREGIALRWRVRDMTCERVPYDAEGWGMCFTGTDVVTSDGSDRLMVRDPGSLRSHRAVAVRIGDRPASALNDLTWADGVLWAVVHGTPYVLGIDLADGRVCSWVDASDMRRDELPVTAHVMNGIAALPGTDRFLLTGKHWRSLYEVEQRPAPPPRWARLEGLDSPP